MNKSKNPDNKKSLVFDYEKQEPVKVSDVKYHNIIITLVAVTIIPLYLYGIRVLTLITFSLLSAFIADVICVKFFYKRT